MEEKESEIKTFKDLRVWQKAHELVLEIYKLTQSFPSEEKFGLVSQLRRAASSVPTNIVEGHKKKSTKEYLYFLNRSDASLEETKYHLILAGDLGYISNQSFEEICLPCDDIGRMLSKLQKRLLSHSLSLKP